MDQAEFERVRQQFEDEVQAKLAGAPIETIEFLRYGDIPEIEPGEFLGRVFLALPEGADPADLGVRRQVLSAFHGTHPHAVAELAKALESTGFGEGLRVTEGPVLGPHPGGPVVHVKMKSGDRAPALNTSGGQPQTPVFGRVGPDDLATLDALIVAGLANSRADAMRWALARIRERPDYEQLRARARETEDPKPGA